MEEHHHSFRAMNTDIDVFVVADRRPSEAFLSVALLFEQQEQRFSRFRESSLLSRFNRGETIHEPWFAAALRLAFELHTETLGLVNPAVLPSLTSAGYDTSFENVRGGRPTPSPVPPLGEAVHLDGERCTLLKGQIDLGGIVKGWTVDLAIEHLRQSFSGALVNAGGDMKALGSDAEGEGWFVEIEPPPDMRGSSGRLSGALATSSVLRRRWISDSGAPAHHLIDPRTGLPSTSGLLQVSVRAPNCARAEAWSKAVLIGGTPAFDRARSFGLHVAAWNGDGTLHGSVW